MGLERKLAEVEVLASDLAKKAYSADYGEDSYLGSRLEELNTDVRNLEIAYHRAKKLLKKKDKALAAGALGDLVKRQKNLADNLNRTMQIIYSGTSFYFDEDIDLRKLEENTKSAPLINNKWSMYYYFMKFHSPKNTLSRTRNNDGHGNTLKTIRKTEKEDRISYGIKERYHLLSRTGVVGATDWMQSELEKYLIGAKTILETISEDNSQKLAPNRSRQSVTIKRARNFSNRHRGGIIAATIGALLATGFVGGTAYEKIQLANAEKQRAELKAEKEASGRGTAEHMIELNSGIRTRFDNWEIFGNQEQYEMILNKRIKSHLELFGTNGLNKDNFYVKKYLEGHPVEVGE